MQVWIYADLAEFFEGEREMDSKTITLKFDTDRGVEYIDAKVVRYLGLNDFERWPTLEEIYELGRPLTDQIIATRHRFYDAWSKVYGMTFELSKVTEVDHAQVEQDLAKYLYMLREKEVETLKLGLVVSPRLPKGGYTIDPFVGWDCSIKRLDG